MCNAKSDVTLASGQRKRSQMNYPVQTEQSLASTLPLSDRESAGLHRKSHLPARAWATPHFWQRECARRNEASATVACNADSLRVWIFPLREKGRLCGPAPCRTVAGWAPVPARLPLSKRWHATRRRRLCKRLSWHIVLCRLSHRHLCFQIQFSVTLVC